MGLKLSLIFAVILIYPFIIWGSTLATEESAASEEKERVELAYAETHELILYESPELRKIIAPILLKLEELPVGKKILRTFIRLAENKKKKLKIVVGEHIYFQYKDSIMLLHINLDKLHNTFIPVIGEKRAIISTLHVPSPESPSLPHIPVYEIGKARNPPHATLGHELIHCIHAMENRDLYIRRNAIFSNQWPRHRTRKRRHDLPDADSIMWRNTEEMITVIGTPDNTSMTEFRILVESGLFPRYGYRQPEKNFYENAQYVEDVYQAHFGDEWEILVKSLRYDSYSFDDRTALLSSNSSPNIFVEEDWKRNRVHDSPRKGSRALISGPDIYSERPTEAVPVLDVPEPMSPSQIKARARMLQRLAQRRKGTTGTLRKSPITVPVTRKEPMISPLARRSFALPVAAPAPAPGLPLSVSTD